MIFLIAVLVWGTFADSEDPEAVVVSATLTSTMNTYPASQCIDGNLDTMCHGGRQTGDTLTLSLVPGSVVSEVKITNREGFQDRILGATVKAAGKLCATIHEIKDVYEVSCGPTVADSVTITTTNLLNLMEVEVLLSDRIVCGGRDDCTGLLLAGDGNCKSDASCVDGLFCGSHNCKSDFGWTGGKWDDDDNCCVDPSTVSKEFSYPRNNLAAIITNMKHEYQHFDVTKQLKMHPNAGNPTAESLWMLLEDDHKKGYYWLTHPLTNARIECMNNTQRIKVRGPSADRNNAQLWRFKESRVNRGRYYIMNYEYPTYRLTMYEKGKMACYDGGKGEAENTKSQKLMKVRSDVACRSSHITADSLAISNSVEQCAEHVKELMSTDDYAQGQPFFKYGKGGGRKRYCLHERTYGCPEGFESTKSWDFYQIIDDSTYYMKQFPQYADEYEHTEGIKRDNECDWDGKDKPGQETLHDKNWSFDCIKHCLDSSDDKACTFASLDHGTDRGHYCHLTQTCSNKPEDLDWDSAWKVLERTSVKGNFIDQLWNLQDIYTTEAVWTIILNIRCDKPRCTPSFTEKVGTSSSFEQSSGTMHGVEKSLQESAGLQFKKLSLGSEHQKTVTDQYTSSISNAQSKTYEKEITNTIDMAKDECVELRQINVNQADQVGGVSFGTGMEWYQQTSCGECDWYSGDGDTEGATRIEIMKSMSKSSCLEDVKEWNNNQDKHANGVAWHDKSGSCMAIVNYEGRGNNEIGWPGVNQWFTCAIKSENKHSVPLQLYSEWIKEEGSTQSVSTQSGSSSGKEKSAKLHTLDQEYHMKEENTDTAMETEETWSKKERKEYQEAVVMDPQAYSNSLAVNFFATVGVAFIAYGAFKYYSGADNKDFIPL